ncbi:MAG: DUF2586 family protein [Bacteroidales bacterium]|nr:DUF2586 family protein [Bacteroidales bacterium]
MASLPNVYITVNRQGLGYVVSTDDGICGLGLTGVAVVDKLELNKAYAVYTMSDVGDLGITKDGSNSAAYRQIKAFYDIAGEGQKLWFCVSAAGTELDTMYDHTDDSSFIKIIHNASGGEVSAYAAVWTPAPAYVPTILDGVDAVVYGAMNNAQIAATYLQGIIAPAVFVVPGLGYTGVASSLAALNSKSLPQVAGLLAAIDEDGNPAIGTVLGKIARDPVQRKISRVKSGALPLTVGFMTDGTDVSTIEGEVATAFGKGWIVFRKFPTLRGIYFAGDPTSTLETDDLKFICNNRVINKAIRIVYKTYVEEVDDEVIINADGTLDAGVIAYLQGKINNAVNTNMKGEISSFKSSIAAAQNVITQGGTDIDLTIVPVGYNSNINITLGFKNPAL